MVAQQGQVAPPEPAAQQGQAVPQPAAGVDPNLTVQGTPAASPADNQGQTQGASPNQVDPAQHFQSLYNKTLAEKYAAEQQLQKMMEMQQQILAQQVQSQSQTKVNPYDPQANWPEWIRWENREAARMASEETERRMQTQFMQYAEKANEQQWLQAHQADMARFGMTTDSIRAFNRMNGIPENNFDVGWRLMTMPATMGQVAAQAINQTTQQFQQPSSGATPIRGTQSVGQGQVTMKYGDLEKAYIDSHGQAYNSWTPEVRAAFDNETFLRQQAESRKR